MILLSETMTDCTNSENVNMDQFEYVSEDESVNHSEDSECEQNDQESIDLITRCSKMV